jgi:hypothetical protein
VVGTCGWADAGAGDGEKRAGLVAGILGGKMYSCCWLSPDLGDESGVVCAGLVAGISGGDTTVAVTFSNVEVRDGRLRGILGGESAAIGTVSGEGDLSGRVAGMAGGVACCGREAGRLGTAGSV